MFYSVENIKFDISRMKVI